MSKWQVELEGKEWNILYLENHDQPRSVSRFGNDREYRVELAKMLATWLHMMKGTPFIYQGQEIGMTNVRFPSIDDYNDLETLNMYREQVFEKGRDAAEVMNSIYTKGHDNARTPMQWTSSENAGFTFGIPWLKINPNYKEINVEKAINDSNSIFHYYKKLIRIRKEYPIVIYGEYQSIFEDHEQIYAYVRTKNSLLLQISLKIPQFLTFQGILSMISNSC
jgi:oligo-1,6-glucosidase